MAEVSSPIVTLAICGFGRAGNMHLTSIRYNYRCQLKYVVDVPAALDSIRSTLKTFNLTDVRVVSVDEFENTVLSDKNLMAVLVTTPTDTHEEYVCKSLKAHKAVFCEKPIANSVEVAKNCYFEASKVQLPLLCAFNRRFDSGFAGIRKQVEEGKIGKVHLVKTTSRDSPLPSLSYLKVSNGMFHDCAVHDIDIVCWIVGEEPYEVYAQSHAHSSDIADINDVDTIAIVMKFPSGVLGIIDLSRHSSYGYDQRLEVFGEKGSLNVTNVYDAPIISSTKDGISHTPYQHSFPTRYELAYRNELDHFCDCVLDPSLPVRVTMNEALLAARIANACEQSCRSKRAESLKPLPI